MRMPVGERKRAMSKSRNMSNSIGAPRRDAKAAGSGAGAPLPASAASAADRAVLSMKTYGPDELAALLPMPRADAHKYSRGKLAIIGGSEAYPGAVCLAAAASQRMGAGYTQVVCDPRSVSTVRAFRPSLVVSSWENLSSEDFPPTRLGKPVAYAVGSGMDAGLDHAAQTKRLVCLALKHAHAPVLVDGGGIAPLATDKGRRLLKRRFVNGWPTVITPHAGEAARLAAPLGIPTKDPGRLACLLALAYGVVAVVKGPDTYISDGESLACITEGTPALAKAGTGDVLAGAMGALLAQGMAPMDAAALAVALHARAGRIAAQRLTDIGVAAEDVVESLPAAIVDIAEGKASQRGLFRRLGRQ